jgi:serine/threonine-protein kinase
MGIVFLARDVALDRLVAIKLLPPELAARADLREAFLREARTAAGLAHPHIVPIHAVEELGDLVFFVMGFIDGETLGARIRRRGALPPAEVMRITQEVAWALGHAHAHGVVHRDVKPDNILLERGTHRAIVTDFGIARLARSLDSAGGIATGTPQYMSPEQSLGAPVDARSDLYSLGVTAFYMATGHLPFQDTDMQALVRRHAQEPAPPVRAAAPNLPGAFADALDQLLAKSPVERIASADALASAVSRARGAHSVVPAAVRRYLETSQQAATEITTLGTVTAAILIGMEVVKLVQGDFLGFGTLIQIVPSAALTGLAAARAGQLFAETRALLRDGYQHGAVRLATVALEREEQLQQATLPSTRHAWRWVWGGAAVTALGFTLLGANQSFVGSQFIGWILGVMAPAVTVHAVLRVRRARTGGTIWNRLLHGRLGRAIFRLAGLTTRIDHAAPSAEPTAVLLARATEDLYHALPGDTRRQLADIPALLMRLQADAAALHALDDADPAKAPRLEAAVAALENIRLDLLKLHSGRGSLSELTADLDRVRDVEHRVDALVELRTPTPTPV